MVESNDGAFTHEGSVIGDGDVLIESSVGERTDTVVVPEEFISQLAEEIGKGTLVDELPEVGQIVHDTDPPHWSNDERVLVSDIPRTRADEHDVDRYKTVASYNPEYPSKDPVVLGSYVSGSAKEYAFPVSRLDW